MVELPFACGKKGSIVLVIFVSFTLIDGEADEVLFRRL